MITIKIKMVNDEIVTRINGTLEEIGQHYFSNPDVVSIEILEGGTNENEYFKMTPLEIYRVSKEEIDEFQLWNNIRYSYKMEYKQGQAKDHTSSAGLCKVA